MAQGSAKQNPTPRRRKMTLEEIRAFNGKLMADPKTQAMIRDADDPAKRDDVVRWEDLQRQHAGR